jgi:hypothetical protein
VVLRPAFLKAATAVLAALVCAHAGAPVASAQPAERGGIDREGLTPEQRRMLENLPPEVLLGARAAQVAATLPVERTLVVAKSNAAFVNAISSWDVSRRFPVLIDDGSAQAAHDVARFVRAFGPERLVFYDDGGAWTGKAAPERADRAVADAAAQAWGASGVAVLDAKWAELGFRPPGVVIASETDPAWPAAVALSAGRGMPLVWVSDVGGQLGGSLTPERAGEFARVVRAAFESTGRPFEALGDELDAVTICMSVPTRVGRGGDITALTDIVGRNEQRERYAWASLLSGEVAGAPASVAAARSAYMAMCALFLRPERARLFDGYSQDFGPPYRAQLAVEVLEGAGLDVSLVEGDSANATIWRRLALGGIEADFVHVNSSGGAHFFNLRGETRAYGSDVPMLIVPSAVHFIHSFSAQVPHRADTIAARWLENGAFAYYGSSHEPFLAAFLPAQVLAARLRAPAPWAAAVRHNQGRFAEPWKLNCFGDALYVWAPEAPVAPPAEDGSLGSPPLDGLTAVDDLVRDAARARETDRLLRLLVLSARDDAAAKLVSGLAAAERVSEVSPQTAELALPVAFAAEDEDAFEALYLRLDDVRARRTLHTSMLWQMLRPTISASDDGVRGRVSLLRAHIRTESMETDAETLAPHVGRLFGDGAVIDMYAGLLGRTDDPQRQKRLRDAMNGR